MAQPATFEKDSTPGFSSATSLTWRRPARLDQNVPSAHTPLVHLRHNAPLSRRIEIPKQEQLCQAALHAGLLF